jgi:hypothetical protein
MLAHSLDDLTEDQIAKFWSLVDKNGPLWNGTPCWLWTGGKQSAGYGTYRQRLVHRRAYTLLRGAIHRALKLDHLCRRPICCNPDHLEPVTHAENLRRGNGAHIIKTGRCHRGHEVTGKNAYISRKGNVQCRKCHADYQNARYHAVRRAAGIAPGFPSGSSRTNSKLKEVDIPIIRQSTLSLRKLGAMFGVSGQTIKDIKVRRVWKHIP